jgi:DNA-binding CsgD family transcriptional regulator
MRAIIVGPPRARAPIRSELASRSVEVVGEFDTQAEARVSGLAFDVIVSSPDTERAADPGSPDPGIESLTARELEVLGLLAEGLSNRGIAERLGISDQTVKFHVASIMGKLGASNRVDTVRRAWRRGLIAF